MFKETAQEGICRVTRIIAIAGPQHAGKTTVADLLAGMIPAKVPVARLKFAQAVYDVLAALGCSKNRGFMQEVSSLAKRHFGGRVVLDQFCLQLHRAIDAGAQVILIDDLRLPEEHEALQAVVEHNPAVQYHMLYVDACAEDRKKRSPNTYGPELHPTESQVVELRQWANLELSNRQTLSHLERQVSRYMTAELVPFLILAAAPSVSAVHIPFIRMDHCYQLPAYKTIGANGMDIYSAEEVSIPPRTATKIRTGWCMALPDGYSARITDRSGIFSEKLVSVSGQIDSDYRGEVHIMLHNYMDEPFWVHRGDRIAQMVIEAAPRVYIVPATSLPTTARGEGGFHSTGR